MSENKKLTSQAIGILDHTLHRASCGLYCGDSPEMQELVSLGLMESAGRKSFVPDEYFRITREGQATYKEWEAAQPQPPPIPSRKLIAKRRYLRWLNTASDSLSFGDWLKTEEW